MNLKNKTQNFKRLRQEKLEHIKSIPFYGNKFAEPLFNTLKKITNVLQVSVCGSFITIVSYKKDAPTIAHCLSVMFRSPVNQSICEYTGLITTYVKS